MKAVKCLLLLYLVLDFADTMLPGMVQFDDGASEVMARPLRLPEARGPKPPVLPRTDGPFAFVLPVVTPACDVPGTRPRSPSEPAPPARGLESEKIPPSPGRTEPA